MGRGRHPHSRFRAMGIGDCVVQGVRATPKWSFGRCYRRSSECICRVRRHAVCGRPWRDGAAEGSSMLMLEANESARRWRKGVRDDAEYTVHSGAKLGQDAMNVLSLAK